MPGRRQKADRASSLRERDICSEAFTWPQEEYTFWQTKRSTPNGLNRYYTEFTAAECCDAHIIENYTVRTGIPPACTEENGRNILAEWESGWDYNPRYSGRCTDYNPVDPNCLPYHDEVCWSAGRKGCRTRRRPKNIGH